MQEIRRIPRRGRTAARSAVFALLAAALALAAAGCRSAPANGRTDVVSGASTAGRSAPAVSGAIAALEGRRVLVVYFSQGESARRVAEDLATLLRADIEPIVEKKQRTWGFFGFMAAGAASSFGRASPIQAPVRDPARYEALVVCTPIWAWHVAPPVRSWLRLFRGKLPAASAFVTVSGDTDPSKVVASMAKESGRKPLASAGFTDGDFDPANPTVYVAKIAAIVESLRRAPTSPSG